MTLEDYGDNETQAVAVQQKHEYAVVNTSASEIQSILQENTGGELSPSDLDVVKVPSGGDLFFKVPTLEGDVPVNEIQGVLVHFTKPRVYWAEAFGTGSSGTPPDCSSRDGVTGIGNPGGACSECPMAQFGTATNADGSKGAGQACSQRQNLFILRPDDILPIVVAGPPTSLKNIKKYLLRLASSRERFYGVVTKLKLVKATSKGGIEYAQIEPSFVSRLEGAAADAMAGYHDNIAPILDAVAIDNE